MKSTDDAVSEIVGASIMLAVTILLTAVFAVGLHRDASRAPADRATVDFDVRGSPGATTVRIIHMGGPAIGAGDLRAVVHLNSSTAYDDIVLFNGSWSLGQAIVVGPLSGPIASGSYLGVTLTSVSRGELVGQKGLVISTPSSSSLGTVAPVVSVTLANGQNPLVLDTPSSMLVAANVSDAMGRKYVRYVTADLSALGGGVGLPLLDDGVGGDAIADDGIYSALAIVPANFQSSTVQVNVSAVDVYGNRATTSSNVTVFVRSDVSEIAANPTQAPLNGTSPSCPTTIAAVRDLQMLSASVPISGLRGNTVQGQNISVFYRTDPACPSVTVTLVSYKAPQPRFNYTTATASTVFDSSTVTGAGEFILNVNLPACYYTVDLVRGAQISTFGPDNTNNYYSRQGRLIDTDTGGANAC